MLRCTNCGEPLQMADSEVLTCVCGTVYARLKSGGLDFLQGVEFADFQLDPDDCYQKEALEREVEGVASRIDDFIFPMIRRYAAAFKKQIQDLTVLDCGCGNGLSVDILKRHGMDAWGIDGGRARHQQWEQRRSGNYLVSANALRLPFQDKSFDIVLSSGLIEHIGIHEEQCKHYCSYRLKDCESERIQFVNEMVRVLKDDGFILLDHPHGAFPADFWHGGKPGSIRWHWPFNDMLPRFGEVADYFRRADASLKLLSLSPSKRLRFKKVGAHWYGRIFAPAMKLWLESMKVRPFSFMARSFLNPYLITIAARHLHARSWIHPY
jgi:SAM-dependent methyltransferase